jgi:hypothetical protein
MQVTHYRQIPGFFSDADFTAIDQVVAQLPAEGSLIEIGCLMGRSTTGWAESLVKAGKTFDIHAIDSFTSRYREYSSALEGDPELIRRVLTTEQSQEALFAEFTRPYPNITYSKMRFSTSFEWAGRNLQCVFEDSDHAEATLTVALPYWWAMLEAGGILCGHDYHPEHQAVVRCVDTFAKFQGQAVRTYADSSLWSLQKPQLTCRPQT